MSQPPSAPQLSQRMIDDEITVRLIATGILQLSETHGAIKLPYPDTLQRGLSRLALASFRNGGQVVNGLAELLEWARRPLIGWPLVLAPSEQNPIGPHDTLLGGQDGDRPTQLCEELALKRTTDVEAETSERLLILDVIKTCDRLGANHTYAAYRRLLIETPVLTEEALFEVCERPELEILGNHLRIDYPLAPASLAHNGHFYQCTVCQNLVQRSALTKLFFCLDETCPGAHGVIPESGLPVRKRIHWLRRDLRRFIAKPGRAEIDLAERLERMGLIVELWPAIDAYDLRVTFPHAGVNWAVDVKDWQNPYYLANAVRPIPSNPPWARSFFVFPDSRADAQGVYLQTFIRRCQRRMEHRSEAATPILDSRREALFVKDFLRLVQAQTHKKGEV